EADARLLRRARYRSRLLAAARARDAGRGLQPLLGCRMVHRAHAQLPHRAVSGGPHRDPPGPRAPPALGRAGAARLGGEDREGRRVAPDDPPRDDTHRSPRVLATPRPVPRDVVAADPSPWAPGAARVALVHDWLTGMRGGERCLEVLCELFPEAPLFTLLHVPGSTTPVIERRRIVTSFVQRLPRAGGGTGGPRRSRASRRSPTTSPTGSGASTAGRPR